MRAVLDTNILFSACWTPGGLEAEVVAMALAGKILPCVSAPVLEEYRDVLFREKFASIHDRARDLLADFKRVAVFVEPATKVTAATDEDDNRFLECAAEAQADYLVTGNLRDYPETFETTKIVNARGFLNAISTL